MKRLFRISGGLFINSIIPVISWIVLAHILGDSRIANVFSITYAVQFVCTILKSFFGSGANVRKEKEDLKDSVWNGIFWGTISSTIIFAVLLIFVDKYVAFFGQDVEFYRIYVSYAIAIIFLQTLLSFIIEKLYFEDKERLANIHLFLFNLINLVVLVIFALIIKNTLVVLSLTIGILLIYIVGLYIWQFQKFKVKFDFFKNFKYESSNIVSSVFMLIIYLFGFKNAFSAGQEYLAALNVVALATDTQWDMIGAIPTVAKIDISKNRFDFKKHVLNGYIFAGVMVLTSIVMTFALTYANGVTLNIVLVYLGFQAFDMLLSPYRTILSIYTQLEYSPTIITIISLSLKALRSFLSIIIISPYCTQIAQVVQGLLLFMSLMIIRIVKYRIVDKKLVILSKGEKIKLAQK